MNVVEKLKKYLLFSHPQQFHDVEVSKIKKN